MLEVDAGEQYKYCIFDSVKHLYVWEESGPMHFWPTSAAVHAFEAQQAWRKAFRDPWQLRFEFVQEGAHAVGCKMAKE